MAYYCFYFILAFDYRNDVRQKANLSTSFIQVQVGHKAVEITCNISNAFGPGMDNECTGWFKKFCKGDESLEAEECGGRPLEVVTDQVRTIIKADPLTTTG